VVQKLREFGLEVAKRKIEKQRQKAKGRKGQKGEQNHGKK
jgi:hypothetical protein